MSSVYLSFFNNLSTKVSLLPVLYFLFFFIKEVCTKPINWQRANTVRLIGVQYARDSFILLKTLHSILSCLCLSS